MCVVSAYVIVARLNVNFGEGEAPWPQDFGGSGWKFGEPSILSHYPLFGRSLSYPIRFSSNILCFASSSLSTTILSKHHLALLLK